MGAAVPHGIAEETFANGEGGLEIGAGPLADRAGGAAHEEVGLAFAGATDEGDHVERGGYLD